MKRFIYTFLAIAAFINSFAQSDSVQIKMHEAAVYYGEGKYVEAADMYESILSTGVESPEIYFNLGNAYYKLGKAAFAILNYERALLLAPGDEDIVFNLKMARTHVIDDLEVLPEVFYKKWIRQVVEANSADEWGKQSLVVFAVCMLLFGIFLFTRIIWIKKISFYFSVIALIYSISAYSFASRQKKKITTRNSAIITARSVTAKSSPSEAGTELFIIHEGLKVELTDDLGEWSEIKLSDGNKGWIPDSVMVKI